MTENNEVVQEEPTTKEPETDGLMDLIEEKLEQAEKVEEKPSKDVQETDEAKEADDSRETDKIEDDGTSKDEEDKAKPEEDKTVDEKKNTSEKEPLELPHNMDKNLKKLLSETEDKKIVETQVKIFKKMASTYTEKNKDFRRVVDFSNSVNGKFNQYGLGKKTDKLLYIENMLKFDKSITKDPESMIKSLMKTYKVKAENLIDENEEYLTDEEKRLNNKFTKIDKLQKTIEQDRRQKKQDDIKKEYKDFSTEKNSDGSLKRPYIKQVQKDMLELMNTYPNATWEELYKKACKLNDDVSKEVETNKLKAELEKKEAERKKKIKKAEKIKKQNLSTRNLNTKPANWEEEIRNAVDDAFNAIA